jgi:hypothetical protein
VESLFLQIGLQFGLPGVVIMMLFLWIRRQEKRLAALQKDFQGECAARVADAKSYTKSTVDLQQSVFKAVEAMTNKLTQDKRHEKSMRELIDALMGEGKTAPTAAPPLLAPVDGDDGPG